MCYITIIIEKQLLFNVKINYNITKVNESEINMPIQIGNTKMTVPLPDMRFRRRNDKVLTKMMERGETFLTSIIASNRTNDTSHQAYQDLTTPSIANMAYWKLKDIDVASQRIAQAKIDGEKIGLVTDFDVDGISSAVVMKLALVKHMGFPDEKVQIFVNNRMLFGYGFTEKALNNVIEKSNGDVPTLLITADQGSNDSNTIAKYKELMFKEGKHHAAVIVTDHHHIEPGESCEQAIAFVNPQRPDDEFEDKTICGCVVALVTMKSAQTHLISEGLIPSDSPKLKDLLTYASLATVADCVSLASGYNRCIVRKGLSDINKGIIPAWRVLKRKLNKPIEHVTAMDLGFTLGPAINADSRTGGDGSDAINFLMAETEEDAERHYASLVSRNTRRKEVDLSMQEAAIAEASKQYYKDGRRGIVVYLPSGSHGIHGIVASRVKDLFNCPTIIFSPVDKKEKDSDDKMITGSGRCIDGLSIVGIVKQHVAKEIPLVGGGHPAAMGLKIKLGDLERFQELFDEKVKDDAEEAGLGRKFNPRIHIDHLIQDDELNWLRNANHLEEINKLEPYGIKFEAPIFALNGTLLKTNTFGKGVNENAHLNVYFADSRGRQHKSVVWHYGRCSWIDEFSVGEEFTFAVTLNYDNYYKTVGLQMVGAVPGVNSIKQSD